MIDLDELERIARASSETADTFAENAERTDAFDLAVTPDVVLSLIERCRHAERVTIDVSGPGMPELRSAFDALCQPVDAPLPLLPLLRAVRQALQIEQSALWGPGAPELRLALAQLPPRMEREIGASWRALIKAAQIACGLGRDATDVDR